MPQGATTPQPQKIPQTPMLPLGSMSYPPPMPAVPDVSSSILKVQLAALAQNLMTQNRPRKDKIFSGTDNSIDFESYMMDFDKVTNIEGATPEMISLELRHWFVGPAGIIVQKYSNEKDPMVTINKTKQHLKKEYGRRNYSARQMLDELLAGPPLNAKDHVAVQTFLCKLEKQLTQKS